MHIRETKYIEATTYDVDLLETLVYEWVRRSMYFKNFHLSNTVIKSTANRFKAILNLKSFSANQEWLQKFRITYNLKDIDTAQLRDIGYKCCKSRLPADIFNELQPKWASLDPKSSISQIPDVDPLALDSDTMVVNETIEIKDDAPDAEINNFNAEIKELYADEIKCSNNDINSIGFLDIEDELPVCTIFGRKTVENVANIISSNTKSIEDEFQPMIVCTDPKNPNINAIDKSKTKKMINIPEVEKIKDLVNRKLLDNVANTSNQSEYIDQFLKEIVRIPETEKIVYPIPSKEQLLKPTPETPKYQATTIKPIPLSKLRNREIKPTHQNDAASPQASNDSKSLQSNRSNRKRKIQENLLELPKNINLEIKAVEQIPTKNQPTPKQSLSPVEAIQSLQTEPINQMPVTVQQPWDQTLLPNITTSNFPLDSVSETQSSILTPGGIMYTYQMPAPNQNQLTMPYISSMATNLQTTQFGQPTLTPIVVHFHSPMTLETTEMLHSSSETSTAGINVTQMPSMSQTYYITPSIDLTQQTSTSLTHIMQNQFMSPITTHVQQPLTTQTLTIETTPKLSTTAIQEPHILEVNASNSIQTTTPTEHVSNCLPTKTTKSIKRKHIQSSVSPKSPAVTSSTSNSVLTNPSTSLPTKLLTSTTSLSQLKPVSTKTPTTSNLSSVKIPPSCSLNLIPTSRLIQPPVATKTQSITSTSNATQTTPTSCLPIFLPKTTILIQPPVSTKTPSSTSSISNIKQPTLTPTKTLSRTTSLTQLKRVSTKTPTNRSITSNYSSLKIPTTCSPKTTLIQSPEATKSLTIASTSNATQTTPTCSSKCLPTTTTTRIQPTVSTITPAVTLKPPITSTSILSTSTLPTSTVPIQNMPISTTNSTVNTKATTPMKVTITKKTKLTAGTSLNNGTKYAQREPLKTREEVVKCIKLMEDFAMMNENFRLIGFLERLEQQMFVHNK